MSARRSVVAFISTTSRYFVKSESVVEEERARLVGIVHNHADNGAVGGVQHRQGEDVDGAGAQKPDEFVQFTQPVGCKDGELPHRFRPSSLSYSVCHALRIGTTEACATLPRI